ncbi:MAG: hypothetical protein JXR14_08215 [Paracoccaceae bacterium]
MATSAATKLGDEKRLAILAQFDPAGGLPAHVRVHLDRLGEIAERRVLVSNSPMDAETREMALSVCEKVIVRENIGWDFAAWRDALAEEEMSAWTHVIPYEFKRFRPPLSAVTNI